MPDSSRGRLLAGAYVLVVLVSTLVWVLEGSLWAALVTVVMTLPFSPGAYVVGYTAAVVVDGLGLVDDPVARVVMTALFLVLFVGLAVADVAMARAAWHASGQRRLRRRPAPTG